MDSSVAPVRSTGIRLPHRSLLLWLAILLLFPDPVLAQEDPARVGGAQPELLWHQATALFPIRVYLPEDFDNEQTYPTVIALHGFAGSSERFERIGRAFAEGGFITVVPEGPYSVPREDSERHSTWELSTWTAEMGVGPALTDDPAIEAASIELTMNDFFPSVIERVREQYRIGPMYLFGFSLGGVYALVGAFHHRDEFDGVIAFGATFIRELFTARGDRLEDGNHLAVRLVLGRSDPLVPFSNAEQARNAFEEAGYQATLDGFDGGHTVPDDALRRAVDWLGDVAARAR